MTYGPYNVTFPRRRRRAGEAAGVLGRPRHEAPAGGAWTLQGWVRASELAPGRVLIAGLGDPAAPAGGSWRSTAVDRLCGTPRRRRRRRIAPDAPGQWRFIVAVCDGDAHPAVRRRRARSRQGAHAERGRRRGCATRAAPCSPAPPPFAGDLAGFTALHPRPLGPRDRGALWPKRPTSPLTVFDTGAPRRGRCRSTAWPGLTAPQDPWTLPRSVGAAGEADSRKARLRRTEPGFGGGTGRLDLAQMVDDRSAEDARPAARNSRSPASTPARWYCGHGSRNSAHHPGRPRRLSRSRNRPEQHGHPGLPGAPGLLVSQRVPHARRPREAASRALPSRGSTTPPRSG